VAHAGGVHDARHAVEARLVEVRRREVERQLVEQLGQHLLVELGVDLAAAQRHLGDRAHARARRDADAAQRRDDAAARGLREVEARGLRREEVGDVPRDERAGRRHADEDRAGPLADRRGGLLAQRGVGLVADDDRVGRGDVAGVADEPLVGLDRDRAVRAVLALHERLARAVLVAAVLELAVELVDEVAPVGEDEDAAGARRLDEAHRRDGLAGARGVLEPEALVRVGILRRLGDLLVGGLGVGVVVERLLVLGDLLVDLLLAGDRGRAERRVGLGLDGRRRGSGPVAVRAALRLGEQRGQRARQRVDLVRVEQRALGELRLVVVEHALEAHHQRELAAPLRRGLLGAGLELGHRGVERAASRRARGERRLRILSGQHEGLAGEGLSAREQLLVGSGHGRDGRWRALSHKVQTEGNGRVGCQEARLRDHQTPDWRSCRTAP
jgi:hypothetical protein